jgi:hypothetical protein
MDTASPGLGKKEQGGHNGGGPLGLRTQAKRPITEAI